MKILKNKNAVRFKIYLRFCCSFCFGIYCFVSSIGRQELIKRTYEMIMVRKTVTKERRIDLLISDAAYKLVYCWVGFSRIWLGYLLPFSSWGELLLSFWVKRSLLARLFYFLPDLQNQSVLLDKRKCQWLRKITAQTNWYIERRRHISKSTWNIPKQWIGKNSKRIFGTEFEITPPAKRRNGTLNKAIPKRIPQPSSLYNKN